MSPRTLKDGLLSVKANPLKWAKVTGGTVTTYTKADGTIMEVHTFTANGTLTVVAPGYARVLLAGSGGHFSGANMNGNGSHVVRGIHPLPAGALSVVVGAIGVQASPSNPSSLGSLVTGVVRTAGQDVGIPFYAAGAGGTVASPMLGVMDDITGTSLEYAPAGNELRPGGGGRYTGSTTGFAPAAGIVIVAVRI